MMDVVKKISEEGLEAVGRYYSKYRAYVVDNEDPNHLSRLKLIIPEITGHQVYDYWAYPAGNYGGMTPDGKSYGMQVIPPINTMIWVEFERGNPEKPIWSQGYHGIQDIKKPEKPQEEDMMDVESYWFQTPGGHRVIISDTKKYVVVSLSTGETIKITEDAISLIHTKAISLGSETESAEPVVMGEKHNTHEEATLDGIMNLTVMTAMGPSSVPINIATFEAQKQKLADILSKKTTTD